MNEIKLRVDSDYINDISLYCEEQGKVIQDMINAYLNYMNTVTLEGITQGETSASLKVLIEYAEGLKDVVESTSIDVRDCIQQYINEIDEEDQYTL